MLVMIGLYPTLMAVQARWLRLQSAKSSKGFAVAATAKLQAPLIQVGSGGYEPTWTKMSQWTNINAKKSKKQWKNIENMKTMALNQ